MGENSGGQSRTKVEGGLNVSTGLNDQISQLGGHIYYLHEPQGSICFISGRNLSQWVTKLSWDLSICSRYWRMVCLKSWHFLMSKTSNSFLIILEIFSKFS